MKLLLGYLKTFPIEMGGAQMGTMLGGSKHICVYGGGGSKLSPFCWYSLNDLSFNSLDMVAPQIQGSGLQGTMLKTSI